MGYKIKWNIDKILNIIILIKEAIIIKKAIKIIIINIWTLKKNSDIKFKWDEKIKWNWDVIKNE